MARKKFTQNTKGKSEEERPFLNTLLEMKINYCNGLKEICSGLN
jgi:hypothetical protein